MKRLYAALTAAVLLSLTAGAALADTKAAADSQCANAVPALKALGSVTDPTDAVKVGDAVQAVVNAYKDCASSALSNGNIEPLAHYAQTRAAQYEVVLGRALMKQTKYDDAHAAFADASRLSGIVADWTAPGIGYTNSNKNPDLANNVTGAPGSQMMERNRGTTRSQFRDAATEVHKAAEAELAKLVPATPK